MARYQIIDTLRIHPDDAEKSRFDIPSYAILSPEETEAKWKEVYNAGVKSNVITQENFSEPIYVGEVYHGKIITTDHWEEVKQSL